MIINANLYIYFSFFAIMGLAATFNWRKFYPLFIIYIFFEDAIRMKIFDNNVATQLAKDFLLIGIYLGWLLENSFKIKRYNFIISILIVIAFQCINILNPECLSLYSAIAGLKLNFFYFPIIWISASYFSDPTTLRRFLLIALFIMACLGAIALHQTIYGPEQWWDFFGNYDDLIHFSYHTWKEEPVFRPFAIFNNSGRYMHLLYIYYFYLLLMWTFNDIFFSKSQKGLVIMLLIPTLAGFFYSINRTGFVALSIVTIAYLVRLKGVTSETIIKEITMKRIMLAFLIIFIFLVTSSLFKSKVKDIIEFLYKSVVPVYKEFHVVERLNWSADNIILAFQESGLMGHGTGSQSLGIIYFIGNKNNIYKVESGYATVIWEMGIIGFILWLNMWKSLMLYFHKLSKNSNVIVANVSYLFILLIISLLLALIVGFQTFQSWIFNIMFWNFLGIVIAIIQNDELYMKKLYAKK
jgi:hypothetical protein